MPAPDLPPRQVTLLLCDRDGALLGTLPAFEVTVPWWQEVGDVVAGAREHHGADVTVLRLLPSTAPWPAVGGPVTYLAEVASTPAVRLDPWPDSAGDPMAEHPLRLPYARPGGPALDLAWADGELAAAGRPRTGPAVQVRTWNLSSIWRLPTAAGDAWLKVVPPFFAHEGAMLRRLDPTVVPPLIAADGPRVLLSDIPGDDHWGAPAPVLLRVLRMLVRLQQGWVGRVGELEAVGAPDWRVERFLPAVARLLEVSGPELDAPTLGALRALERGLPERFEQIADCGVPDTLVHGDFHPGNTRGSAAPNGRSVLLDWGDCGIGNPLLDQAAFLASIDEEHREPVRAEWARLWRDGVPGCDPERAAHLVAPVSALRQTLIYRMFLDSIEPDERVYHRGDPKHWLDRAAQLASAD
ncbi:MAG TPA: aminoglycoside phosphotransferase family protein [Actinomycetes bacterium]